MAYRFNKKTLKDDLNVWLNTSVPSAIEVGPDALKAKWDQREAVYNCDKKYAGPRLFDNVEPYPYDVMGPVVRSVKDTVMASLTGPQTYCQAIPLGATSQESADVVERGLQDVLELAGIERQLDAAVHDAVLLGIGFVRVRMDGMGLYVERIHPGDMVVACSVGETFDKAGMAGHRLYVPYWEFCQRVEDGLYDWVAKDEDLKPFIGFDATTEPAGFDPGLHPGTQNPDSQDDRFEDVQLFELIVRMQVGSKKKAEDEYDEEDEYLGESEPEEEPDAPDTGLWRVVWSKTANRVLHCEPFSYDRHWYFDVRFHDERPFWPVQSVAGRIMPQCLHISHLMNLAVTASMAGITRPVMMAGGVLGQKITSNRLGQVMYATAETKLFPFPFDFDISGVLAMVEQSVQWINKSAGVTESRLSGEYQGAQTATEVSELSASAQRTEGAKSRYTGDFIERIWQYALDLLRWSPDVVRDVYGDVTSENFQASLKGSYRLCMTNRSPGASGPVLVAKLQQILMMSAEPGSPFHRGRTQEAVAGALDVIDLESVKKTDEELEQERQDAETAKQMAMAQAMAKSGGGPGAPMGLPQPVPNGRPGAFGDPGDSLGMAPQA